MHDQGVEVPDFFNVVLVSELDMAKLRQENLRPGERNPALTYLQLTKKIINGVSRYDTKCSVYVLYGLHEDYFRACLAHEFMHVWLFANASKLSPALEEGACNYMSYIILKKSTDSDFKKRYIKSMENDPSPTYGIGFRKVRKLAEELGSMENLIAFLRHNHDFPKSLRQRKEP